MKRTIIITGGTLLVTTPALIFAGRDFAFSTSVYDGSLNSLTVDGSLIAGRNVGLTLAGGLGVGNRGLIAADGNINSTSAFANIGGNIAAGTLTNPGTLSLTTRGDLGSGADFILGGTLQSSGALSVVAARGIDIASGSFVTSDSSVSLTCLTDE